MPRELNDVKPHIRLRFGLRAPALDGPMQTGKMDRLGPAVVGVVTQSLLLLEYVVRVFRWISVAILFACIGGVSAALEAWNPRDLPNVKDEVKPVWEKTLGKGAKYAVTVSGNSAKSQDRNAPEYCASILGLKTYGTVEKVTIGPGYAYLRTESHHVNTFQHVDGSDAFSPYLQRPLPSDFDHIEIWNPAVIKPKESTWTPLRLVPASDIELVPGTKWQTKWAAEKDGDKYFVTITIELL